MSSLRIAVSGYVGTGKSALCRELAERLDLHLIEEDMTEVIRAGAEFKHRIETHPRDQDVAFQAKTVWARLFATWAERRSARLGEHDRVIADRWHADLLVWWLQEFKGVGGEVEAGTTALVSEMHHQIAQLDHIVMTPLQEPFFTPGKANEDGLVRRPNKTDHLLFHSLLRGLILTPAALPKLITLPAQPMSIAERADFVECAIERAAAQR